jgi:hypothetical protein
VDQVASNNFKIKISTFYSLAMYSQEAIREIKSAKINCFFGDFQ